MVVPLEGSPFSTENLRTSVRVILGFMVPSLTKALLPRLLSLARRTALGRFLVVPNFFHLRMMEATVFLVFGILLGSPLAVAKAAATLPGLHTKHET
jgi:hypothetical protein